MKRSRLPEVGQLEIQLLQAAPYPKRQTVAVSDGLARVRIEGVLVNGPADPATLSTDVNELANAFYDLAADESVNRVLVECASGGGSTSGVEEAAYSLKTLATKKPVYVAIQNLCASGAYWIVSQATKVYASRASLVGSIGTVITVDDYMGELSAAGIRHYVVRSAPLKAIGEGEVTQEQLNDVQRVVTELNALFLADVNAGRKRDLTKFATGQVWLAQAATQYGLIDGVARLAEVEEMLLNRPAPPTQQQATSVEPKVVPEDKTNRSVARLNELYNR